MHIGQLASQNESIIDYNVLYSYKKETSDCSFYILELRVQYWLESMSWLIFVMYYL